MFFKILLFIGLYVFMGSLVCLEVSPRIVKDNVVLSKRFNKIGWSLMFVSMVLLVMSCLLFLFSVV